MTATRGTCCARRRNDGIVDEVEVDRAVSGQSAKLSPAEFDRVVYRLARERRWGLELIARHTGYSKSQVNTVMRRLGVGEQANR